MSPYNPIMTKSWAYIEYYILCIRAYSFYPFYPFSDEITESAR